MNFLIIYLSLSLILRFIAHGSEDRTDNQSAVPVHLENLMNSNHYQRWGAIPYRHLGNREFSCDYAERGSVRESNENKIHFPKKETTVAIGISIRSSASRIKSDNDLLAAARDTWMKDAKDFVEVLIFVDCDDKQTGTRVTPLEGFHIAELPKLHWFCYQPVQSLRTKEEEIEAVKNNFDKYAAMYTIMLREIPGKHFYLKIDSDTVIIPMNIYHLVLSLDKYGEKAMIIGDIGERRNGANIDYKNPENWIMYRARNGTKDGLFKRQGWIDLERAYHPDSYMKILQSSTATGIQGGLILFSTSALQIMVEHDCMKKVGNIPCTWKKKKNCINRPEDLVVGLCAHLHRILLVDCHPCMRNIIGDLSSPRRWVSDGLKTQKFCKMPLSTHPVKNADDYVSIYQELVFY